jgi:hypothetical protein
MLGGLVYSGEAILIGRDALILKMSVRNLELFTKVLTAAAMCSRQI